MARPFDSFAVLGGMRTGSNLLETVLNGVPGLRCHGEAFNPNFVGYPKRSEMFGTTRVMRDADPAAFLARLRAEPGLNGFRYFNDHDPRVLLPILDDPRCAKIVLTRNPLDSYLSLLIARQTDQWKISNVKHRRSAEVTFVARDFAVYLDDLRRFHAAVRLALQTGGQCAFWVDYSELRDTRVLTGLVRFLGIDASVDALPSTIVPQNPGPADAKVANAREMRAALAALDPFGILSPPVFEAARGAGVAGYVASTAAPLLFLPMPGGPAERVTAWLAAAGGIAEGFTQGSLRQWQRDRAGHVSFTVLRHPVLRAFAAFERAGRMDADSELGQALRSAQGLTFPAPDAPADDMRAAFGAFVGFLAANLAGQTALRTRADWATQSACLSGIAGVVHPDLVLREDRLADDLPGLARRIGLEPPGEVRDDGLAARMAPIWSREVERAARAAYGRDYTAFGFADWRG